MGSCASDCASYCGKQGQETGEFKTDQPNYFSNQANNQSSKSQDPVLKGLTAEQKAKMLQIVKIQAWWKGQQTRKYLNMVKLTRASSSKYFTQQEARETVTQRKYDPNAPRQQRPAYTFQSGAVYTGEWKGGFRDGQGQQKWPDGARYIGAWKDNKAHGRGTFYHTDGDVYEGFWANDKAHGEGVYTHKNGAKYQGCWREDLQHGFGVETWTDNSKYIGNYQYGSKHGLGIYQWADQSRFMGEWEENKISGIGRYDWIDERTYTGQWLENNMDGFGIYFWPDGRKYQGQYKDDKKHGFGVYSWQDGRCYEGYWTRGKQHGLGTYKVPKDGKLKFGLWEDGKRIEWFSDEQINQINNGQLDYTSFFKQFESGRLCDPNAVFKHPFGFDEQLEQVKKNIVKTEELCNQMLSTQ